MFTGLIESTGLLTESHWEPDGVTKWLTIAAPFCPELALGESVSVNGTCLTVVDQTPLTFSTQVSPTTLSITTLGTLLRDQPVNLERSVTPNTRLGGHWVLGHVDTIGHVESIIPEGESHHITLRYPTQYQRWVVPEGSITLDGISLTIIKRELNQVGVTIIPHTWAHTIIKNWHVGGAVNIEFDVLGKYLDNLMSPYAHPFKEEPTDD